MEVVGARVEEGRGLAEVRAARRVRSSVVRRGLAGVMLC